MQIGEASKLSGATVKAIRHYEAIGLLPNIPRKGKYRIFRESDIALIQLIKKAQELGLKLSDLKTITNRGDSRDNHESTWLSVISLLNEQDQQLQVKINQLQQQKKLLSDYKKEITECLTKSPTCTFPE